MTAPALDEYQEAERSYWEHFGEPQPRARYREHFEAILKAVRAASEADGTSAVEYAQRLDQARDVGERITWALAPNNEEAVKDRFWLPSSVRDAVESSRWDGPSPVSIDDLASAASDYLAAPWMQTNLVDWYLLNGLIFDTHARCFHALASGELLGRIPLAYALAGGNIEKTAWYKVGFGVAAFSLRWLLAPAIMLGLYALDFNEAIPWIAVPWGLYACFRLLLLPLRLWNRHQQGVQARRFQADIDRLGSIYDTVRADTFSPSRLRDQIRTLEQERTILPPVVHSLVAQAVQRNPTLFSKHGQPRRSRGIE